jgi:hypothetical protein
VSLDGKADDGEPGEHDDVQADFEHACGTDHDDVIEIPKGGGADGLDGDDTIVATHGAPGLLSCGGGDDVVLADSPGSHSGGGGIYRGEFDDCEHVRYICHVPRLKGRTLDAAKRALKRGHCKVRRMTVRGSGPHRVVSARSRAPGPSWASVAACRSSSAPTTASRTSTSTRAVAAGTRRGARRGGQRL